MTLELIAPEVLADLLGLVMEDPPTAEQCAARTMQERELAERWATSVHLRASDNPVRVVAKPAWLEGIDDAVAHAIGRLTVKLRGRVRNIAEAEGGRIRWGWAPPSHARLEAIGLVEHDGDHAKLTPLGDAVAVLILAGRC